jgi:PAS domain S-box-containing protein
MDQVIEFFKKLFDSSDWPPRWHCGQWTEFHGWLYIISDLLIWSAYFTIPIVIIRYISRRKDIRFAKLYFLFAAFILACGGTHFLDAVAFWIPAYRLNALFRLITAVISWITVFYIAKYLPVIFSLKSQKELEAEIEQRKKAEERVSESEEQVQTIFDAAPDAVIVIDESGKIVKWNPRAETLLGWKENEVIGKSLAATIIPERFREVHKKGMHHFLQTGEGPILGKVIETCALTKSGNEVDIALNIAASPKINNRHLFIGFLRDISGQKRAEQKFRDLLDAAPDAMIIANAKGEIVLINQQTEILFGYTRDELIGKPVEILIPHDFHGRHMGHRNQYFTDPKVRSMGAGLELFAIRKDGTQFPVEISLSPLVTEEGTLVSASVRDITDRKRAEQKFRGLLEAAPDAMIIANEKGEIVLINKQTEKLFGYERKELIGKPVEILIPTDFHSKHIGHRTEYFSDPKVRSMGAGLELFAIRKDGTQFPVEISLSPLVTEEGTLVSASVRDITARKRSEEKFRGLLEAAPDAMIIANEKGIIVLSNRQTEKLFGYTKEELTGKPVEILIPYDFRSKHIEHRTKYFNDPRVRSMGAGLELFAIRKDGTQIPVEISLSPLVTEEGTLISASVRDITSRKKAEESIRFLASIATNIQDTVISSDTNYNITRWNEAAEKLLEWKSEEVIGKTTVDVLKTIYLNETREQILEIIENRGIWQGEIVYHTKSGKPVNVMATASKLKDAQGNITGNIILVRDITDRILAEEKLKEFEHFFNNSNDFSCIANKDGYFEVLNPSFERVLGYSQKELSVNPFINFVHPDDIPATLLEYEKLKSGAPVIHFFNRYRKKDGNYLWFDWYATPNPASGKLYCIARDITDRRKAEEALSKLNEELEQRVRERTIEVKKNEKRFRALIENSDDIIALLDETLNPIYRSPSAERLTGYTIEDRKQESGFNQIHPDDLEKVKTCLAKIKAVPGKPFPSSYRLKHKDGHYIWLEGSFTNLFDEPTVKAIVANMRDVTERKKAEETLAKTTEEKNIILESIGDAFFALDKTWTVTYWNRIAEEALGVRKHEIVGKNLWEIFSSSVDSESYVKYHEAVANNEIIHFEDFYPVLNKWYEISAYPSENGLSVYFKDVTERRKAEEEIKKLNAELEEKVARRTEELRKANSEMEAFTYSVSHDLRAPLRGIIGFTTILEEDYTSQLDDEAKRISSVIRNNAMKMGHLIDDLLAFSRTGKQELMKTTVNTPSMVHEIVDDLTQQNRRNTPITWNIHDLPSVKADINTIRQVWINLISNAIKYSGKQEQPAIEIGSRLEDHQVIFYVKDNGVGFDDQYKHKLFKVFQRLHNNDEFEGTGVGLALVEKIVSRHGGRTWAEGKPDEGACFYFSLPH